MKNPEAVSLGKRGGQKTASLYGSEHFSNANKARKSHKGWPRGKKRKNVIPLGEQKMER